MNNDFIARYIYAVTRHLPQKIRADVEKELDGLISDMLEERCARKTPTEDDVRAVLTELGTPEELAAKYSGYENRALISGAYLLLYRRIIRLVLPIAASGIALAGLLSVIVEWNPGPDVYRFIGETLGRVIGGAIAGTVQAFAVVTIIFAVLEHKKVPLKTGDMFSNLPPVPVGHARIKPHEPILGMMWAILGAILLIGFPQIIGAWFTDTGWIPVFNTGIFRTFWPLILLWTAMSIVKETVALIDGQHTIRLAVVTAVANVVTMATFPIVFLNQNLMNPDFSARIGQFFRHEGLQFVAWPFLNFKILLVCLVLFALILEIVVAFVQSAKRAA